MFYRELKEGEVIQEGDFHYDIIDHRLNAVKRSIGKPVVGGGFLRPVKVPSFEEVQKLIGNDKLSIGGEVYNATLKLIGLEEK